MRQCRHVFGVLLALVMMGCSASGPTFSELQQSGKIPALRDGMARIYFYREDSIVGVAVRPEITVDGAVVGRSIAGGFFYVDVLPGPHASSTLNVNQPAHEMTFVLAAGETKYIHTAIHGAIIEPDRPDLSSTAAIQRLIATLSFTGPSGDAAVTSASRPMTPANASPALAPAPLPAPGAQLVRIMGADFQARLIENQTFRALAPSGRTLEINMTSGTLKVHNVQKNGHGSGLYQIDRSNATLCFSNMSRDFGGMTGCYAMFRIDDTTVELSLSKGYSLRYAMSAELARAGSSVAPNPAAPITGYDIIASPTDAAPTKYQGLAESFGEQQLCTSHPHADVVMIDHDTEFYAIACDAGDRLMIKCAAGQCHPSQ